MDLKKAIKHQELKDLMVKKQGNGHHELALEIGLEALQISEEWQIYRDMGCSSLKLGNFEDAIKFFKKQVKLVTKIKDAGGLQNLAAYKNLIDAQCRAKDYQAAMKTCEKIKMFNLNSQNIHDVPLKSLQLRFSEEDMQDKDGTKDQVAANFERYLTYQVSVWICLSKAEIFTALDNPALACHWLDEIKKILCEYQTWITPKWIDVNYVNEKDFEICFGETKFSMDMDKGLTYIFQRKDLASTDFLVSFYYSSFESIRASWLIKTLTDCGPYCTKNEGKCGHPTICKLVHRILTVGIVCLEYMDKYFASSHLDWESLKKLQSNLCCENSSMLKEINKAIFYSPFSEDKVILFINHLIETSLNEDIKKKIIRYKNSMLINSKLQLTMKNLEKYQNFCEEHGINRRKAINLTAYFG